MKRWALILAGCAALFGGGCAAVPSDPAAKAEYLEANDPLEPLNRTIFSFNQFADRNLIKPVAKGYVRLLPQPARDSVRNFVSNLNEPMVFGNNVLQGQFRRAGTTATRFVLNSTLGVAGLMDPAVGYGFRKQVGDVGQTLYAWGVPDGPYLVLPLLGPSNPRDAAGLGLQILLDPYRDFIRDNHISTLAVLTPPVLGGIDERARALDSLDAIQREAIDYYASLRSLFRQDRDAQLRGDNAAPMPGQEGFYEDPGGPPSH